MWKLLDEDVEALIRNFERSDWREMRLRMEGVELILAKDSAPRLNALAPATDDAASSAARPSTPQPAPQAPSPPGPKPQTAIPEGCVQIRAPSLGTFYRSPKPGVPPFVEVGSKIAADSEICLIEVMKLFTTVRAGIVGTVREIYAADADLVEFDQPLFLVEP